MIVRLTTSMRNERRDCAEIYQRELPESELCALGREFLERFYFGSMLEDPRYFCFVYLHEGGVAGLTTFTTDTTSLLRDNVLRSFPLLCWIVGKFLVAHPWRVSLILKVARTMVAMGAEPYAEVRAEIMSTAITKEHRTLEFYRRTGVNIANELYHNTARVLAATGVRVVKGFTRRSNVFVHAAISSLGWKKVFQGKLTRGPGPEDTCIWLWDVGEFVRDRPVAAS